MQTKKGFAQFDLGTVLITKHALRQICEGDLFRSFIRYSMGDWGELPDQDRRANEKSLGTGGRLFASYTDRNGRRFWIITEADRSVTTLLLPEDY